MNEKMTQKEVEQYFKENKRKKMYNTLQYVFVVVAITFLMLSLKNTDIQTAYAWITFGIFLLLTLVMAGLYIYLFLKHKNMMEKDLIPSKEEKQRYNKVVDEYEDQFAESKSKIAETKRNLIITKKEIKNPNYIQEEELKNNFKKDVEDLNLKEKDLFSDNEFKYLHFEFEKDELKIRNKSVSNDIKNEIVVLKEKLKKDLIDSKAKNKEMKINADVDSNNKKVQEQQKKLSLTISNENEQIAMAKSEMQDRILNNLD